MSHSFHHTLLYASVPACSGTLYLQVMGRLVKNLIDIMSGKNPCISVSSSNYTGICEIMKNIVRTGHPSDILFSFVSKSDMIKLVNRGACMLRKTLIT